MNAFRIIVNLSIFNWFIQVAHAIKSPDRGDQAARITHMALSLLGAFVRKRAYRIESIFLLGVLSMSILEAVRRARKMKRMGSQTMNWLNAIV